MPTKLTVTLPERDPEQVDDSVRASAELDITPSVARQKVNRLVAATVGPGLSSGKPALVAKSGRLRWRVPVYLALPNKDRLGQVGQIDVDARTGETLADDELLDAIRDHAERLASGSAL